MAVSIILSTVFNKNKMKVFGTRKACSVKLLVCLVIFNISLSDSFATQRYSCTGVRALLEAKGFPATELQNDPVSGSHLKTCSVAVGLSGTCCSDAVEGRLDALSRQYYERTVKEALSKLAAVLSTRAQRFNDFFQDLLSNSKQEFHAMFKRTYGVIYEQNSYVFTDLFAELEQYYARGNVDLGDAMESFFNTLYQKMFAVLNSQYQFDDKYLGCVSEHMKELKPFGDVPDKLSVQIKRSFVATRTYAQALSTASEAVKNMLALKPTTECTKALMRMQHCNTCSGHTQRACSNYCTNVMKGCLAYHAELDTEWDNFVGAIDKVSDRLLGPFNIEMVVEPIDIKISEAIMNFQENGHDVSQQVFTGCGKPVLGKRRRRSIIKDSYQHPSITQSINYKYNIRQYVNRNYRHVNTDADFEIPFELDAQSSTGVNRVKRASNRELQFEPLQFSNIDDNKNNKKKNRKQNKKHDDNNDEDGGDKTSNQTHLDKLVADIRARVRDTRKFWSHLAYQICNNEDVAAAPSKDNDCWNGKAIDKYSHAVVGDGLASQKLNPEVIIDASRPSTLLNEQLFTLKTIVNNLRNAYNGLDVEWPDYEEPFPGSGSGSGDGIETDDEDLIHEGSGGNANVDNNLNFNPANGKPDIYSPPDGKEVNTNDLDMHINNGPNIDTNAVDRGAEGGNGTAGGASNKPLMSLSRALMGYLLPIVVIWFGGMFSEML